MPDALLDSIACANESSCNAARFIDRLRRQYPGWVCRQVCTRSTFPVRKNGFYSLSCSTNDADWSLYSPCGIVFSNSIFDVGHCVNQDEIMPDNADTYAFFVASSRRLGIRTFMTQNIGALPKNRGEKQKRRSGRKEGF